MSWFSILHCFCAPFVAMNATVWGVESLSHAPSRSVTGLATRDIGDSYPDPDSVFSHLAVAFHSLFSMLLASILFPYAVYRAFTTL